MKAMILAAGEGTRLRPLTLTQPKPMLPISGRPALEWILLRLAAYNIREIAMNLSYMPDAVMGYFGDGKRCGVHLTYSVEESLMGTAGGVKRLESFFDEPFVLVYGDVLTDLDLGALIASHNARPDGPRVSLSLAHVANPTECGIVEVDSAGRVSRFVEKPPPDEVFCDLANAGILIMEPEILAEIPAETFYDFSLDLFPRLLAHGVPLYGWEMPEETYLLDIGTPDKYARAQAEWPTAACMRQLNHNPAVIGGARQ